MAQHIAVLRGWHPALAMAELTALLPSHNPIISESNRFAKLEGGLSPSEAFETLAVSSGCQAILLNGFIHNWQNDESILLEKVENYLQNNHREGKMAVVPLRIEGKLSQFSSSQIAGKIGGFMSRMGWQIDLSNPDNCFSITIDGSSAQIACGWMVGDESGSEGVANRKATQRPFFKPVSLSPRLALLAVNLAAGPIGHGPVIDAMTGTGGFIIEAAATNRQALGIDLNSQMVEGANQNLKWLLEQKNITKSSAKIVRGDATKIEDSIDKSWIGQVKGFVLDPPYGRNSQGSLNHDELLTKTLTSAHQVASNEANLVLIVPINSMPAQINSALESDSQVDLLHGDWNSLQQLMKSSGWQIKNRWIEHVHGSLSRLVIHSEYVPLN
jgi:tRNA (guanine10-N2)-dimethyltransferase